MMYSQPLTGDIYPRILQRGSSSSFGIGDNDFDLQFVFYKGLQLDSADKEYPMATSLIYNNQCSEIGSLQFPLDTADGIYEILLEKYFDWLMKTARPMKADIHLGSNQLKNFDFLNIKRALNINYLVKNLKIQISETQIKDATIEFYKR